MLYALGDPVSFVLLVVAFVLAVTLSGWLSALACSRLGAAALRGEGRLRPDPRRQLDPFGAVGAGIAGIGWARPVELARRGGGAALALLTGPLVLAALGLGLLGAFGALYGSLPGGGVRLLQDGLPAGLDALGARALLLGGLMALFVGVLQLVPLPPLPGGSALFAVAPRTLGWQRAHYQLVERNIGTAVLLALLLIPLGGSSALLPSVLGSVLDPLVRRVTGG